MKQQLLEFYRDYPKEARAAFGDEPFELKNILKYWVRSKDSDTHIIPTDTLYITKPRIAALHVIPRNGMPSIPTARTNETF